MRKVRITISRRIDVSVFCTRKSKHAFIAMFEGVAFKIHVAGIGRECDQSLTMHQSVVARDIASIDVVVCNRL